MNRRATHLLYGIIAAVLLLLLIGACTNDLKKIQEISAKQNAVEVDTTRGVDVIFSDSAKVKFHLLAPLMLEYPISKDVKQAYQFMPKGVKIIYFDPNTTREICNIVADTAYYYTDIKLAKLYKNVVITSTKGDVFKSDELIWDQTAHKIYSNKPVDGKMADGNIGHGSGLETNEKFDPFTVKNQTGLFYVDPKFGQ